MRWGTRYSAAYVNRLYAGVKKHLDRPFRFLCVTDDTFGLLDGIEPLPFKEMPGVPKELHLGFFTKLLLTADNFGDFSGPTLFLDIDQVITGPLDVFFDYKPGRNCIIHNWLSWRKTFLRGRPNVGNSSVFRYEAGKSNYIFEKFVAEWKRAIDRKYYRTEQAFLTYAMGENREWWPDQWIRSVKRHLIKPFPLNLFSPPEHPEDCRIICFHGSPDPEQLIGGYMSGPVYRWCREPQWFIDSWVATEHALQKGHHTPTGWGYLSHDPLLATSQPEQS